ncbi:hypothetical protein Bca101_065857 [Brassica carinata]
MKLVCLISFFFFFITTSLAVVPPPNPAALYQNFLQCFSNQTQSPPNSLSDVVLPQTAPAFTPTLRAYIRNSRFNTSTTSKPLIVIAARSEPHVQAAVLCTKSLNVQLKTRSGGHDYEGWQFVAPKTDPSLFMRLLLQPVTRNKAQTVRASVVALFLGKSSDVVSLLTRDFPELGLKQENCTELTWIQSVLWWANNDNATQVKPEILLDRNPDSASYGKRKSDYVEKEITKEGLDYLMRKMIEVGKTGLVFNPYGGKMSEVATTATPFPHRTKLYKVQHSINWKDPGTAAESSFLQQTRSFYSYMAPFVTQNPRHTYLNYRDLDIGVNTHGPNSYREAEVYGRKYFGENFDRLVKVKTAVDPQNFFRDEQSVPTLPAKP